MHGIRWVKRQYRYHFRHPFQRGQFGARSAFSKTGGPDDAGAGLEVAEAGWARFIGHLLEPDFFAWLRGMPELFESLVIDRYDVDLFSTDLREVRSVLAWGKVFTRDG